MADLYRDFVFAALAGPVDDSTSAWLVDDTSSMPSEALLAKGEFWLVAESPLVHPPSFEIVKLTGVDIASSTLTVVRGQRGTAAAPHASGTMVKGALTTDMIRQIRGGATDSRVPPPDGDVYAPGDRFYSVGDGGFYEFTGMHPLFAQDAFNDTYRPDVFSDGLSDPLPVAGRVEGLFDCSLRWREVEGVFGSPPAGDGREYTAVARTASPDGRALTLLNVGSPEFAVHFTMIVGSSSDVDAGFVFNASADGRDGYYLSIAPGAAPELYRVVEGTATAVLSLGTDPISSSDGVDFSIRVRGQVIDFWYRNTATLPSDFWYRASFTETDAPRTGSNIGFLANSDACFADSTLAWTYLAMPVYARSGVAINNVTEPFFRIDSTGAAVDQPATMTGCYPYTEDWVNLLGVFGVVTTGHGQVGRYQSGAVDDQAIALQDLHGRDFDLSVWFIPAGDPTAEYGVLLRATHDAQTGFYLGVTPSGLNLYPVVGGTAAGTALAAASFAPADGGAIGFRVVVTQDFMQVYDALDTQAVPLLTASLAGSDLPSGGTWFGWMLRNAVALADTELSLYNITYNDLGLTGGWRPATNFFAAAGPPRSSRPPGAVWLDHDVDEAYISLGVGGRWRRFGQVPTNWTDTAPALPWTGSAEWYRNGERIYFRGSVAGGSATDQLFDVSAFAPDDNGAGLALVAVLRASDGTCTPTVLTYTAADGLRAPGMVGGATLLLDSVTWRRA